MMLEPDDTGHAWMKATPDARQALCEQLAGRIGRDRTFLLAALETMYERGDAGLLSRPIEEVARISVAAMHMRPREAG